MLSTPERRYAAFRLFARVAEELPTAFVKSALSPQIVRSILALVRHSDNPLAKPASKAVRYVPVDRPCYQHTCGKCRRVLTVDHAPPFPSPAPSPSRLYPPPAPPPPCTLSSSQLEALVARAKTDPTLAVHAITELTGPNGSTQFDQRTKTKTIEGLMEAMTPDQLAVHVAALRQQVLAPAAALAVATEDDERLYGDAAGMCAPPSRSGA